jgi:hypothetical protein
VIWLQPAAWWGVAAVALPLLIHLLARQRSRRLLFPSLKFLRASQVAALRRRAIADWPLLIVRVLMIVAATAACAAPVFLSADRRAAWDTRVARALVIVAGTEGADALAADEARSTVTHRVFTANIVSDALDDAVAWLGQQPPAAREIVVIGDLREGVLNERAVGRVPSFAGIRFLPVISQTRTADVELQTIAATAAGAIEATRVMVTPELERTRARYSVSNAAVPPRIRIDAAPADTPLADAMLRAVLREGVVLDLARERQLAIAFEGAAAPRAESLTPPRDAWMRDVLDDNPAVRGGETNGALVVRVPMAVTSPAAAAITARVVASAFAVPMTAHEPRRIAPATLARWSRSPGRSPESATPVDEGDRRWLWGVVLVLLGVEHLIRRARARVLDAGGTIELDSTAGNGPEDVRVA